MSSRNGHVSQGDPPNWAKKWHMSNPSRMHPKSIEKYRQCVKGTQRSYCSSQHRNVQGLKPWEGVVATGTLCPPQYMAYFQQSFATKEVLNELKSSSSGTSDIVVTCKWSLAMKSMGKGMPNCFCLCDIDGICYSFSIMRKRTTCQDFRLMWEMRKKKKRGRKLVTLLEYY